MFDIGFVELMLVGLVSLLVIGPERLPETIRTIMLWVGRIRRTFTNIKTEIEQEIGADEIRRQLHNESILKEFSESKNQIQTALEEADQSLNDFKQSMNDSVEQAKSATTSDANANTDPQKLDRANEQKT